MIDLETAVLNGISDYQYVVENTTTHGYTACILTHTIMADEEKGSKYKVQIAKEIEAGVYANAASVHFNSNECILDFAYQVPSVKEPTLKIVGRVNMSHRTAESFLKVLSNALLDFKNKQGDNPDKPKE